MPMLIANLPPDPAVVYTLPSGEAQGESGAFVAESIQSSKEHWEDRAEWIIQNSSGDAPYEYDSLPLKSARTVKVKYKKIGKIKPMSYEWDD